MVMVNWIEGQNVSISSGNITKVSGGNAWNAGAKGDQTYDGTQNIFFEVKIPIASRLSFGLTETIASDTFTNDISYRFELNDDFTYTVYCGGIFVYKTGTYEANDVFKVAIENGIISFYINDVFMVQNTLAISFPVYIDGSIYSEGQSIITNINGDVSEPPVTQPRTAVTWIDGENVTVSGGTITKNLGVANGYNAGARGDKLYESTDELFFEVETVDFAAIAFGFTELSGSSAVSNTSIDYRIQLSTNGAYNIYARGTNIFTGSYLIGDVFKVSLESGKIVIYVNDVFIVDFTDVIVFPIYIDGSIYKEGYSITAVTNEAGAINSFIEKNISMNLVQEISLTDVVSLDVAQVITRDQNIQANLNQLIFFMNQTRIDFVQAIVRNGQAILFVEQVISRESQVQVNLGQIITREADLQINLGQIITRNGNILGELSQIISRSSSEILAITNILFRSGRSLIGLEQRFLIENQTNLYTRQTIYRAGESILSLGQDILFATIGEINLDMIQRISHFSERALQFNLEIIGGEKNVVELTQIISRESNVTLDLNQRMIVITPGEIALGLNQMLYNSKGTALEVGQIIYKDSATSVGLRQAAFIRNEIRIDLDIFMVDYFTYIGEIHLQGEQSLYESLQGQADRYIPMIGNVETYLSMTGAIDVTKTGQDFSMMSGDTKILVVTMDEPMNLAGVSLRWGIRKNKNTKESLFVKTLGDGITIEGETMSVKLEPIDTELLSGDFHHEMELTDGLGNVSTIFTGRARIETSGV